jgi:2,3-diketo-5-methylthio-1-phosphopentane phosphatase
LPPADLIPRFPAQGAPVSFIVDFDGTISQDDVTDLLIRRFAPEPEWREMDERYDAGLEGSRDLTIWDLEKVPDDPALLLELAARIPLDRGMVDLVAVANGHGAAVEVVSDGMGFYVGPALERLGLGDVPIATNEARFGEPDAVPRVAFPYGHPNCFVCGTCKRERVRMHQGAGRAVVLVGDGMSDRFGAAHADVVFAKRYLARICDAEGWRYEPWERLSDVATWSTAAFDDGRLPGAAADYDRWRGAFGPAPGSFICGPEVWGPGRTTPRPLAR